MKIGVLGGTFNPIHNGHIEMARKALEMASLDEVWVMPAGMPPHKENSDICLGRHRMKMCELACAYEDRIIASDFEIKSTSFNYTYQTLENLHSIYPMHQFFFIMGQDSVNGFDTWREPQKILDNATLLVFLRGKSFELEKEQCLTTISSLKKKYDGSFLLLEYEPTAISSTDIRNAIRSNDSSYDLRCVISKDVYDYIKEHRLYEVFPAYDVSAIKKSLKKELKESRYKHILGVADTACSLALKYGYPEELAGVAGLLHDCAKYMSNDELLSYAKKHHIDVLDGDKKAPHLLHAPVGAYLAKHKYGIKDKEILHAISVHTTGCKAMNLLDKIIFISDYIEPNRNKAPRLDEIRSLAYENLDDCIVCILEDTIKYIKSSNSYMDLRTIETYEYYQKENDR